MTRHEVIMHAIAKKITWIQTAQICGVTDRQMRRLMRSVERRGYDAVVDHRARTPRRQRIPLATLAQVCALTRERYPRLQRPALLGEAGARAQPEDLLHVDEVDVAGGGLG